MAHLLRKKIKIKIDHATDHGALLKINRAIYPIGDLKNELQQRTLEMQDQDVQKIAFMILDITDLLSNNMMQNICSFLNMPEVRIVSKCFKSVYDSSRPPMVNL